MFFNLLMNIFFLSLDSGTLPLQLPGFDPRGGPEQLPQQQVLRRCRDRGHQRRWRLPPHAPHDLHPDHTAQRRRRRQQPPPPPQQLQQQEQQQQQQPDGTDPREQRGLPLRQEGRRGREEHPGEEADLRELGQAEVLEHRQHHELHALKRVFLLVLEQSRTRGRQEDDHDRRKHRQREKVRQRRIEF